MKKALRHLCSTDRRIFGEREIAMSSEDACVQTYYILDNLIKSDKRNILINSAHQGQVLKHLKSTMKKNGSFINALQDKRIPISLSHCNFLIPFHERITDYPKIVHCLLELRFFFIKNLKILKEVAAEVFAA